LLDIQITISVKQERRGTITACTYRCPVQLGLAIQQINANKMTNSKSIQCGKRPPESVM